ncbi:hypothetical protein [Nonlabens arenilitoris]|nr:hypothetical protein [Nonlabens arenilitoris]
MRVLRNYFEDANEDFQEDVFLMIVNNDGTVYALKINDSQTLNVAIEYDLSNAKGSTTQEKIDFLNENLRKDYAQNSNLELTFLKFFESYGATLYEAADQNLSNWNLLELNNNKDQVVSTTCK